MKKLQMVVMASIVMGSLGCFAQSQGTLYWVVDSALAEQYAGWTAVLVRGSEAIDSAATPPTSAQDIKNKPRVEEDGNGGWYLYDTQYGIEGPAPAVHGIAKMGPDGEFALNNSSNPNGLIEGVTRFNADDVYAAINVPGWGPYDSDATLGSTGVEVLNYDRWDTVASQYSTGPLDGAAHGDSGNLYPYYMFLFKTETGNINDATEVTVVFMEELYPTLPPFTHGHGDETLNDDLVVRFVLGTVPEPTTTALFALGVACLGLRRRRRS